ncbi:MAG: bactofilin family protein [Longimicrobiales bacterium]
MAKDKENQLASANEGVISIIGPGMHVDGDCETQGTLRVEGSVKGAVRAGKAVVLGKDGRIDGDVFTQDAVIGGNVKGTVVAESRLELQATCVIEGEVRARRIKLDEGGRIDGRIQTGDVKAGKQSGAPPSATSARSLDPAVEASAGPAAPGGAL